MYMFRAMFDLIKEIVIALKLGGASVSLISPDVSLWQIAEADNWLAGKVESKWLRSL